MNLSQIIVTTVSSVFVKLKEKGLEEYITGQINKRKREDEGQIQITAVCILWVGEGGEEDSCGLDVCACHSSSFVLGGDFTLL